VLSQPLFLRRLLGLENTQKPDPAILRTKVLGLTFSNPIGLAAGFDKDGQAVDGLLSLGFGFAEVGSVTPLPQPGNPSPRVFRLSEDRCVINRYGFNSAGALAVAQNLAQRRTKTSGVVGINLGKNKTSEDASADYVTGLQTLAPYADYVVVNVSSPNTPGLRSLQGKQALTKLLSDVQSARARLPRPLPLLVKIAPDVTEEDRVDIAEVVITTGVDGIVISNTTLERPSSLKSEHKHEIGGLSGPVLEQRSTQLIADMYHLTKGKVPIIGVGGISSGEDALNKIKAGASLIQLYTAFVYDGPCLVEHIKLDLVRCLQRDGFTNVSDAVGIEHRKPTPFRTWTKRS
jgi:dihydroorotate dehydrogenase